ncbi:response regulator [Paenibacillus sp. IB182363]|uniref:Response regulator n=1 Tax=Paenibacillus oceani TaxID=2772510 RepID=A0A927CB49_9BACL|nr:response regulator [Paenibacillus oceani]
MVDDEEPAIRLLEIRLGTYKGVIVAGTFMDAEEAMEAIRKGGIDAVFLDIHMPGINGMVASEIITGAFPDIDIIFVTAFEQYAIEAFERNAVDYVLKPPVPGRLDMTIERLLWRQKARRNEVAVIGNAVALPFKEQAGESALYCFGRFRWVVDGREGEPVKWRRTKDRELMAYLTHNRNSFVPKETLLEALWPGADPEQSTAYLYTCFHHIRKLMKRFGCRETLESGTDGYQLLPNQAISCLQRALQVNPFPDDLNETLLTAYAQAGDRYAMIRHYTQFVNLLHVELDIRPMESTVRLYQHYSEGSAFFEAST